MSLVVIVANHYWFRLSALLLLHYSKRNNIKTIDIPVIIAIIIDVVTVIDSIDIIIEITTTINFFDLNSNRFR